MKGKRYNHERIAFKDPITGVKVLQLTSFPTMSMSVASDQNMFSHDSKKLIFLSQRSPQRDAPWDLFIVDSDGSNLTQLTEVDDLGAPALAGDGKTAYFMRGSSLWRVDTHNFEEKEVASLEGAKGIWSSHLSPDGRYFFISMQRAGERLLVRFDIRKGLAEPIAEDWIATANDPKGRGLLCIDSLGKEKTYGLVNYDGELEGVFTKSYDFAHYTLLGPTLRIQGCALPPDRAILTLGLGEEVPTTLVKGHNFWHSSSSLDGKWIVCDTNWPNEGLKLISVEERSVSTLLYPHNSGGHPQWTHAHPFFSPDGRKVLYNSDATGICQIYLAQVPQRLISMHG